MSRLDDMVAAGYAEARRVAVVKQNPMRRTWFINGHEYTDLEMRDLGIDNPREVTKDQLSLLQLMQGNIISRQQAMEGIVFDPVMFGENGMERGKGAVNRFDPR